MRRAFTAAYFLVVVMGMCGLTLYAHLMWSWGKEHTVYRYAKITNDSPPNELELHFGKYRREFDASLIGLPDGVCDEYTNQVSWRILVCYGGQPEVMNG